ncbi:MAG: hypothetical protein ACKV2T_38725 [Kofleriaceae bacterium]
MDGPFGEGPEAPIEFEAQTLDGAIVTGQVRDHATARPIADATVSIGSAVTTTDDAGSFLVAAPLGMQDVRISLLGYVPFEDEIGVSGGNLELAVRLATASAPNSIGVAGGSVTVDGVAIEVAAGLVPDGSRIGATFFGDGRLGAASGRMVFEARGESWRVFGQLHLDTETPDVAMTLRIPLPSGQTAGPTDVIAMRAGTVIEATSVADGVATFTLLPRKARDNHFFRPRVRFAARTPPGWYRAGDTLPVRVPVNTTVTTAEVEHAILETPTGRVLRVMPMSEATPRTCSSCPDEPDESAVDVNGETHAHVPPLPMPMPMGRPRFTIRTRAAVMGVRGTTFDVGARPCDSGQGTEYRVNVGEGSVHVQGTNLLTVNAGASAAGCADCMNGRCADCTRLARCTIEFQPSALDENNQPLPYIVAPVDTTGGVLADVTSRGLPVGSLALPLVWTASGTGLSVTPAQNRPQTGIVRATAIGRGTITATLANSHPASSECYATCDTGRCRRCENSEDFVCATDPLPMTTLVCNADVANSRREWQHAFDNNAICGAPPFVWLCGGGSTCGGTNYTCCLGMTCSAANTPTWQQGLACDEDSIPPFQLD